MSINHKFVKILLTFLTILICVSFSSIYADDIETASDAYNANDETELNNTIETSINETSLNINSRSCIVLDRLSNNILYGKNEKSKVKMASTTKIMTATVIIENCNLNDTIEVSKKAAGTGGSRLGLKTGDKITIHDLLYGLMLCSGNDAAVALAESCAGSISEFSNLMNNKAKDLGLTNTNFESPHGLDSDDHYTTAYELALLSNYALKNPTFAKIVGTKNYTITINGYPKNLSNTNELLGNLNGVYGIKTGFTNGANRCLVTACKRNDLDIICVVLGCDTKKFRTQDSIKLIEYAYKNYEMVDIYDIINSKFNTWKNDNLSKFNINKGITNNLDISLSKIENNKIPIKKENIKDIDVNINCTYNIDSPIYANTPIGNLNLSIKDTDIINLDIIVNNTIRKKSSFDYFKYLINNLIPSMESIL
ncbi:MAG: D-alanyl-D-alanine carboxypeptidase [Clostridia bacterium]|nr:D-alanyl-D-alanine carboxypeptidase [Clostridia bacterium]